MSEAIRIKTEILRPICYESGVFIPSETRWPTHLQYCPKEDITEMLKYLEVENEEGCMWSQVSRRRNRPSVTEDLNWCPSYSSLLTSLQTGSLRSRCQQHTSLMGNCFLVHRVVFLLWSQLRKGERVSSLSVIITQLPPKDSPPNAGS